MKSWTCNFCGKTKNHLYPMIWHLRIKHHSPEWFAEIKIIYRIIRIFIYALLFGITFPFWYIHKKLG